MCNGGLLGANNPIIDATLWYVLAAANALSGDSGLIAGTQLKVPEVGVSKNDSGTFKPYNPNEIVGSTSPSLPFIPPQSSSGCGYIIQAVMAAAAIVVSFYLPVIAPHVASALGTSLGVAEALIVGGTAFAAHAGATAVGSAMGLATFSWRQSVREGVIAGVTFGLGKAGLGEIGKMISKSKFAQAAAQAVINSTVSAAVEVGASKIAGLDSGFSWKSVAISAVTQAVLAPAANRLGDKLTSGISHAGVREYTRDLIGGIVTDAARVGVSQAMGVQARFSMGAIVGNAFASSTARAFQAKLYGSINESVATNDAVGPDDPIQELNNPIGPLPELTIPTSTEVQTIALAQSRAKIAGNREADTATNKLPPQVNDQLAEIIKYARSQENLGDMSSEQILDYAYKKYYRKDNPYSGQYAPVLDTVTVTGTRSDSHANVYGPLRSGYQLANGGQSRTYLEANDVRSVKRDIALTGVGGIFDAVRGVAKKLPSELNFGVTWKKSSSIVEQLMVTSGKYQAGLSQPTLELSMAADMPKWSVPWAKAVPVLKGANIVATVATPLYDAWQIGARVKNGDNVTSAEIGNWTVSTDVGIAAYGVGGLPGLAIGVAWLGANSYAQSQHYTPLFGEYAGLEINGWNAMRIRGNEYQEVRIRQNIQQFQETREQATIRFETQQTLEYVRRMEHSKL